jgi:hypothetical protein
MASDESDAAPILPGSRSECDARREIFGFRPKQLHGSSGGAGHPRTSECMKNFILLSVIFAFSFSSFSENRHDVLVWAHEVVPRGAHTSFPNTGHYVNCEVLNAPRSWNGLDKFPLDLGAEVHKAAGFISKRDGLKSPLKLQIVNLRHLDLPESIREIRRCALATTNEWFLAFTFSWDFDQLASAVLLLNGTFAEERRIPPNKIPGATMGVRRSPMPVRPAGRTKVAANPYHILYSVDLQIPSVQWNPARGEFPVDIQSFIEAARSHLEGNYSLDNVTLSLNQMEFHRFVPSKAVAARGLELARHMHHWVCVMRFLADGGERELTVYVLLDGTVICATDSAI